MVRTSPLYPFFLLWPGLLLAQGGPPLITDDPGTPGDSVWEINFAFAAEKGAEGEWLLEAPLLDINYGVGERIQLKFEVPWVWLDEDGEDPKNGLGNSTIGVKWRFFDQEDYHVNVSVYPQCSFNNPTSSADRGLADDGTELFLPVEIERSFGRFSLNPELGFAVREEDDDGWEYGLALGYKLFEPLELLGEIHGEADDGLGTHDLVFNAGCRWELTEGLTLLAAAGRGLRGSGSSEPEFLGYLGLQFVF
jgi:hypothetical protein